MGFTRYWTVGGKHKFSEKNIDDIKFLISEGEKVLDIKIKNEIGVGEPRISETTIWLNGDSSKGEDYESFCIDLEGEQKLGFCKTQRKPYDIVVATILKYLYKNNFLDLVESDGDNAEGIVNEILDNLKIHEL